MERKKLALAPRSKPSGEAAEVGVAAAGKSNPFGSAKPRAGRADDYVSGEGAGGGESAPPRSKPDPFGGAKPKVDPFGGAKPRTEQPKASEESSSASVTTEGATKPADATGKEGSLEAKAEALAIE